MNINKKIGATMRVERMILGVTIRELAGAMGYCDSHLCYLENGKRTWSTKLQRMYREALPKAAEAKKKRLMDKAVARLEMAC